MKQIRQANFRLHISSSKKTPFEVSLIPLSNDDKFMIIDGHSYPISLITRSIEEVLNEYLKYYITFEVKKS